MKPFFRRIAAVALAALPITGAITPEGMLAAPRRGVALANPSGVNTFLPNQNDDKLTKPEGLCHLHEHELLLRRFRGNDSVGTAQPKIWCHLYLVN